jgi:hypothetical protein
VLVQLFLGLDADHDQIHSVCNERILVKPTSGPRQTVELQAHDSKPIQLLSYLFFFRSPTDCV